MMVAQMQLESSDVCFPNSLLLPQEEGTNKTHQLTQVINSWKRQCRTRSFTGWPMAAGMSAVKKWLPMTHSPTPTENTQAAWRRRRSGATMVLCSTQKRLRGGCAQCRPLGQGLEPTTLLHLYITPCPPHLPISTALAMPGESQTQVRWQFEDSAHAVEKEAHAA